MIGTLDFLLLVEKDQESEGGGEGEGEGKGKGKGKGSVPKSCFKSAKNRSASSL